MNYSCFWATLSERVADALTVGWTVSARVDGLVENPFSILPPREPHNRKGKRTRSLSSSFLRFRPSASSLLRVHWCSSSMLLWPRYLCLPVADMSDSSRRIDGKWIMQTRLTERTKAWAVCVCMCSYISVLRKHMLTCVAHLVTQS